MSELWSVKPGIVHHWAGFSFRFSFTREGTPMLEIRAPGGQPDNCCVFFGEDGEFVAGGGVFVRNAPPLTNVSGVVPTRPSR